MDDNGEHAAKQVRVAIVEDDTMLGQVLADAVQAIPECSLVGVAETLSSGLRLCDSSAIDVVLVDLGLPDGSGLELIRRLRECSATTKILVVSIFADARSVVRAIEAGADGYLLKGAEAIEVAHAIRTSLAGGAPLSPAVASHILARLRNGRGGPGTDSHHAATQVSLTPRETSVLELLAKGLSYKEVARLHDVSYHTVADHVKAIYRKLAVNSRSEAVFEAIQAGLISVRQ